MLGKTPDDALKIKGNFVHEIPLNLIKGLKIGEFGFCKVSGNLVQIARTSDHQFTDVLRFVPDNPDSPYRLFAMVTPYLPIMGRMLTFNLVSVYNGKRHPILNAKKFVHWMANYMHNLYPEIGCIVANWQLTPNQMTNTQEYLRNIKQGRDRKKAAKSTWSGRTFGELGYKHVFGIQEVPPMPSPFGVEPPQVIVYFARTNNIPTQIVTHPWVTEAAKTN